MVPPFQLHDIGLPYPLLQLMLAWAYPKLAAIGLDVIGELRFLRRFQANHGMAHAILPAFRRRHQTGQHLADAAAQVGRDMK